MAPHAARKHFQWPPRAHSVGSCPLSIGLVRNNSQEQLPLSKSASSPPSPHAPLGSSTVLGMNVCSNSSHSSSSDPTEEPCTVSSSWTESGMTDTFSTLSTVGNSSSSPNNRDKPTSMGFVSKGDSSDRGLAGRLGGESLELARQAPTGSSFPAPQQAAAHTQRSSYLGCTEEPTEDALQEATGGSSSILSGQTVQASNTLLNRCSSWSAGGSHDSSSAIRKAPTGVRERLIALQRQQAFVEVPEDSDSTSSPASSVPWLWKRNVVPCGEFRPSIGEYHLPSVSDFAANPLSAGSFSPRKVGDGSSKDAMQKKQDEEWTNAHQTALRRPQSDTATAQLARSSKPLPTQQPARSNSGAHAEATDSSHGRQGIPANINSPAPPVTSRSAQQAANYSGCDASAQPVEDNSCDAQLHMEPASTQSCLSPNSVRKRAAFFEGLIHSGTPTYITVGDALHSLGLAGPMQCHGQGHPRFVSAL